MDFRNSRYQVRLATTAQDVTTCQQLRHRCFYGGDGQDQDAYDATFAHLMVTDSVSDDLIGTLRYRIAKGQAIDQGYAAGFYDVTGFLRLGVVTLEIGRFCTHPAQHDPQIVRVAWGALTRIVDAHQVELIFGCTSFAGSDPSAHTKTLQRLARDHLAPKQFNISQRSSQSIALRDVIRSDMAQTPMPPLLRTYLAMGGWVSDHAIVDTEMNTIHVLTGLEIARVPSARAKALRALV